MKPFFAQKMGKDVIKRMVVGRARQFTLSSHNIKFSDDHISRQRLRELWADGAVSVHECVPDLKASKISRLTAPLSA